MRSEEQLSQLEAPELLRWAAETFGKSLLISTSFQREGMVILDMASRVCPDVHVITLDTGRLPEETHRMIETVRERYGFRVEVVLPDPGEVAELVVKHGPNAFYHSLSLRMLCCEIRKIRPLKRKLAHYRAWVVGLRRAQTAARSATRQVEEQDGLLKISPLADWTSGQVAEYIRVHHVPEHPLYARGYASIGCTPCTRPVVEGEEERAGRWWWEQDSQKECGIHFSPNGSARPAYDVPLGTVLKGANA
jgi:thioredoxin-dependent adenylylsulfate APS reductase